MSATLPGPSHAHAVLHCNLNTTNGARASAFYMAVLDLEPIMRSIGRNADATAMGLPSDTDCTTTFLYDQRGPRVAPAMELAHWTRPATLAAHAGLPPSSFRAIGYQVPSLRRARRRLEALDVPAGDPVEATVRGERRPALRVTDPDGVAVELVEGDTCTFSHLRLTCADLDRTTAWYETIGWHVRARAAGSACFGLADDPTFSLEFAAVAGSGDTRSLPANTRGLYRIALAVDDVRASAADLAAIWGADAVPEPAVIPMPDTPTGGFTVLFLRDPDGAMVELVERPRTELRRKV